MATLAEALTTAQEEHGRGNVAYAEQVYRRILDADPLQDAAWSCLALVCLGTGRLDEAVQHFQRALRLAPENAGAHSDLGIALANLGRVEEAVASFREAIRLEPGHAAAHNNLGIVLVRLGLLDEAVASYREALRLKPGYVDAQLNLNLAFLEQGNLDEAAANCWEVLGIKPDCAAAHNHLGNILSEQGKFEQALGHYDQATLLNPESALFHWNRALTLLMLGDFERGWPEFEWRLRHEPLGLERAFRQPCWDGSPLAGRTLLLYTESGSGESMQGFGDALQFVRYVPLAARRGGRVVLECQQQLRPLFGDLPGVVGVVARGDPLPPFDVRAPLQSLPRAFATTLETIPDQVPYLAADAMLAKAWRGRLTEDRSRLRVGLVWSGSRKKRRPANDPNCALDCFAPLARVSNVTYYSLQKGQPASASGSPPPGMRLLDETSRLVDFAETAALISQLDLVLAVDTSVAHLAGALGKPVWVLLPFQADFRWLVRRVGSPWYPSMRPFRQKEPGNWTEVCERAAGELEKLSMGRRGHLPLVATEL